MLHKVAGVELVGHAVRIMRIAGIDDITVVVSRDFAHSAELHQALLPHVRVSVQAEQFGTADALQAAQCEVESADTIIVAPVDVVLVTDELVKQLLDKHITSNSLATIVAARVDDPTGLGRIKMDDDGNPSAIFEQHEADDQLLRSNLINTAWYCFDNHWIWDELDKVRAADTGEFYLPRIIASAAAQDRSGVVISNDPDVGIGVNNKLQLSRVESIMRQRTNRAHMVSGVTIDDPAATYIDVDVEIGVDTTIRPGSHIGVGSVIGSGVVIGPNTQITGSRVGDNAIVDGARVLHSIVGEGATVGSNALVRHGAELKPRSKVGNLAEIKNSVIGSDSSVSHFSYVGDASVGENVNIGAGTITCNFDGKDKHKTVIEDDVLIGSSTMLVAPVTIGKAARTGAGSVVRVDVMPGDTVAGVPAKSIKFS